MKALHETKRCQLFKEIAESTWNRIIEAHEVGVDLPEIGITADILVKILRFSKSVLPTFDVFAKKGWNEKMYGSDIDVFVEVGSGNFVWFALQAKVLKKGNRYTSLRDTSDSVMQWEKLELLESLSGCKGFYLLYNGLNNFHYDDADSCSIKFDQSQFGCSLVSPKDIKNLAEQKIGERYVNPKFQSIHPKFAHPWRILVCCNQKNYDRTLYKLNEILKSNPSLYRLKEEFIDKGEYDDELTNKNIERNIPIVPNNSINIACQESGWNPIFRIIIRTTESATKIKFGLN